MIPKVDTFEHDISDEIRRKEASLTDISAASNNVGNNEPVELPKKPPVFIITLIIFFVLSIAGFGMLGYFYFSDNRTTPIEPVINKKKKEQTAPPNLEKISPALANSIGHVVTSIDKKEKGYVLTITDYPQVFAYMTRNEKEYIEDLAALFPPVTTSQTETASTQKTPQASTTLSTTTETIKTIKNVDQASGTPKSPTTTPTVTQPITLTNNTFAPYFSDITISNQNMRVFTSSSHKILYAFIGNKAVVVSDSPEGILYLKSAILK